MQKIHTNHCNCWNLLGRGILVNLLLEVHSDISMLAEYHPGLAHQFDALWRQIDSPRTFDSSFIVDYSIGSNSSYGLQLSKSLAERYVQVKMFDDLLRRIRQHGIDGIREVRLHR